ncbi:MAG: hypothetical protein SWC96_03520 [Thermodesulfobacteriota bacterium]|nr:hypothetical protein [Thermodesulfobacteriota bacterium]
MKNTDRRALPVVGLHYEGTGISRKAARIRQGFFPKRNRADETAVLIPSSTILYCLLAKDLGLSVSGVLAPGHTFCLLDDGDRQVVVETTNRYGFEPGRVEVRAGSAR